MGNTWFYYNSWEYTCSFLMSKPFAGWLNRQVDSLMKNNVGLHPSSRVGFTGSPISYIKHIYESGIVSKIHTCINIQPEPVFPIVLCWQTKSGKQVLPTDEVIDEDDLEFWIEGLEPEKYWAILNRRPTDYPFKVDKLHFPVEVEGFATHMALYITLTDANEADAIAKALAESVEQHNLKSEKNNRNLGVVHRYDYNKEGKKLTFNIDLGSAGAPFIQKLLKTLNRFSSVAQVTVGY